MVVRFLLKLILPFAFWLLFFIVLEQTSPAVYQAIIASLRVDEFKIESKGSLAKQVGLRFLDQEKSILHWLYMRKAYEKEVLADPLVKEFSLEPCSWYRLDCYKVSLLTREPLYQIEMSERFWLVSEDSTILRALQEPLPRMIRIIGISAAGDSPEVRSARINFSTKLVKFLKLEAIPEVRSIRFGDQSDIYLRFREYDFILVLGLEKSKLGIIREQLSRFKLILEDLGPAVRLVKQIDLAFDRQGIVRLKTPAKQDNKE